MKHMLLLHWKLARQQMGRDSSLGNVQHLNANQILPQRILDH